jgi:hypothetical protein
MATGPKPHNHLHADEVPSEAAAQIDSIRDLIAEAQKDFAEAWSTQVGLHTVPKTF